MYPDRDGMPSDDNLVLSVDLDIYDLPTIVDDRGSLTFCEFGSHVPFEPKRFFFITGVPEGVDRGGHAHRQCHQLWVCLQGSMLLTVDNGTERKGYRLDDPSRGHLVPAGVWNDLTEFAPGTVLFCLTSHAYDATDYIHGHDEYVEWAAARD